MTVFNSFLPPDARMFAGDYITSPSQVYWAVQQNDGNFVVYRGSNAVNSGPPAWATGVSSTNLGGFFNHMQTDGNFVIYTSATGLDQGTVVPVYATHTDGAIGSYFASLADNGEFAVYQGTDPDHAGSKLFSNHVNDPATSINIASITYDFAHATIGATDAISGSSATLTNNTPTQQSYDVTLSLSYEKTSTWTWDLSESLTLGVKSTSQVGVPGLGNTEVQFSISETTTFSEGQSTSTSTTKTFTGGNTIAVPADSVYQSSIVGQHVKYNIPYTFEGVATYHSGAISNIIGSGIFNGADGTLFQITTTCVSAPGGCDAAAVLPVLPAIPVLPVPEPATFLLLPTALVAAVILLTLDPASRRRLGLFRRSISNPEAAA
jgi:hypothetical protein